MPVHLSPVSTSVVNSPESHSEALVRLEYHRSLLEREGIAPISGLGTLELAGNIIARPGITAAPAASTPSFPPVIPLPFRSRWALSELSGAVAGIIPPAASVTEPMSVFVPSERADGSAAVDLSPDFVEARLPETFRPLSFLPVSGTDAAARETAAAPAVVSLTISTAYFVGKTVTLADNTVVVLDEPHQYLVFIAEKLIVGHNVTFTYRRPVPRAVLDSWAPGDKPPRPPKAPTPNGLWGVTGAAGDAGVPAGHGFGGVNAPEIEMWVLEMTGSPMFDLQGQDGTMGGRGGDGGDGGDGSDGRRELYDWLGFCSSGAGPGGDGGRGGNGGPGGHGGTGGHGGRLKLYGPAEVLLRYAAGGFSISTSGGRGGARGSGGTGGAGGRGGLLGPRPKNCAMSTERHDGAPGAPGSRGEDGREGTAGGSHPDATYFVAITEDDFQRKLTEPALISAAPSRGVAGTSVTLSAARLTSDDVLLVDGVITPMTVVADTLATFTVPAVRGGHGVLQVRQTDGTTSNRLSFYVQPQVTAVGDGSRQRPGAIVTVTGSGFAVGARVRVTGEDMPDSVCVNGSTMTFTLRRPERVVANPEGELADLQVILSDGEPSNTVQFTIDTLRTIVVGDSVAWGQGLQLHEKYPTQVEAALAARNGGVKSYTTNLAHSGATIGIGDPLILPAIDGEVPTSYPTVAQQVADFTGNTDVVDLVLVTAGLNDVNIRTILNPLNNAKSFAPLIEQRLHKDLRTLLVQTAAKFLNATIVATSYYPILSDDSDTAGIEVMLVAAGLSAAALPGGILAGASIPQIRTNCRAFHDLSTLAIATAVEDANEEAGTTRILFADPRFTSRNAALAPEPWVYAVNGDLSPQDHIVAPSRAVACSLNRDRTDVFQCERASVGHPNPVGALKYAEAIVAALDRHVTAQSEDLTSFPPGFMWGVATAAMQNEGGIENNDWAAFATSPAIRHRVRTWTEKDGNPVDLQPAGEAVRHGELNVLRADLDRALALGINSYRFSVEWARIEPTKPPALDSPLTDAGVDMTAVAYYDAVLDELAARNMTPVLTLNHLALPLWVLDPPREATIGSIFTFPFASADDPDFRRSMRGWENPETVEAFLRFVRYIVTRWSARVRWWVTLNEPVGSMIGVGYIAGIWPPGFTGDGGRGKVAYFNLIRAHARAYELIKALDSESMVGIAHAMMHAKVTTSVADHLFGDQEAARNQFDYFYNWHILEALIDGRIDTAIHRREHERDYVPDHERATWLGTDPARPWSSHCDYVGLNFYRSVYVFVDQVVSVSAGYTGGRFLNNLRDRDQTHNLLNDLGWEISPEGFGTLLRDLHRRYGLPVLVTENGIPQASDGARGAFLTAHLRQILDAVRDGVHVSGYMYWTLVDNWEWHEAYRPQARFGLYTVDRDGADQPRILTAGARALAYAIARNDLRGAEATFGAITPAGDRVRPPRFSPLVISGNIGAEEIAVWLTRDPTGQVRGMLHEVSSDRRLPLTGTHDTALRLVTVSHPAMFSVGAGTLSFTLPPVGGAVVSGVLRRQGDVPWSGDLDLMSGQWRGQGVLRQLTLARISGNGSAWAGWWLSDELPRGWWPLVIAVQGPTVTLDAGPAFRYQGVLSGAATIVGDITIPGSAGSSALDLVRLPDGFTS